MRELSNGCDTNFALAAGQGFLRVVSQNSVVADFCETMAMAHKYRQYRQLR
jgi:hypothetical protein